MLNLQRALVMVAPLVALNVVNRLEVVSSVENRAIGPENVQMLDQTAGVLAMKTVHLVVTIALVVATEGIHFKRQ